MHLSITRLRSLVSESYKDCGRSQVLGRLWTLSRIAIIFYLLRNVVDYSPDVYYLFIGWLWTLLFEPELNPPSSAEIRMRGPSKGGAFSSVAKVCGFLAVCAVDIFHRLFLSHPSALMIHGLWNSSTRFWYIGSCFPCCLMPILYGQIKCFMLPWLRLKAHAHNKATT